MGTWKKKISRILTPESAQVAVSVGAGIYQRSQELLVLRSQSVSYFWWHALHLNYLILVSRKMYMDICIICKCVHVHVCYVCVERFYFIMSFKKVPGSLQINLACWRKHPWAWGYAAVALSWTSWPSFSWKSSIITPILQGGNWGRVFSKTTNLGRDSYLM